MIIASRRSRAGSSLVVVVLITTVVSVMVGSVLCRTSTNTVLSRRTTEYNQSASAALAASEKIIANLTHDFLLGGDADVSNKVDTYPTLTPSDNDLLGLGGLVGTAGGLLGGGGGNSTPPPPKLWSRYQFSDVDRKNSRTSVDRISSLQFTNLHAGIPGLRGYASSFRVLANARETASHYQIVSAVAQDIQLASVPLFQFQVFYVPDLEIGAALTVEGRLHSNQEVYLQPPGKLTLSGPVTTARAITFNKHPQDGVVRSPGPIEFSGPSEVKVNTFNFPIGTNSTPALLHALIDRPPISESPASALGQQRYYNKADLMITAFGNKVFLTSGRFNLFSSSLKSYPKLAALAKQNVYNKRENKDVAFIDVDLAQLYARYSELTSDLGRKPRIIFVTDLRSHSSSVQSGVRLLNGANLPAEGLTIVSSEPLYVQGHFNLGMAPVCLAGDAVTILSEAWNDANAGKSLSSRRAAATTINAAIIAGIVPTASGNYSGGIENAVRLLEDWGGTPLTFKGALAVLYYSKVATAPWGSVDVYAPPQRRWSYNAGFLDPAGLPPGTPEMRTVFRGGWKTIKPHARS